jgi:hypothetical protein
MAVTKKHKDKTKSKLIGSKEHLIKDLVSIIENIIDAIDKQIGSIELFESSLNYEELGGLNAIHKKMLHDLLVKNLEMLISTRDNAIVGLKMLQIPHAGGRKKSTEKNDLARTLAQQYFMEKNKHYSGKQLSDAVNRVLFNQDSKRYAEEVAKKIKTKEYDQHNNANADPLKDLSTVTWSQIKSLPGPYSTRSANAFLKAFKEEKVRNK